MSAPVRTRRRFTALEKQEAVDICLQGGLSHHAVAERLGLPSSSQAHIVCDLGAPRDQGMLGSEDRVVLQRFGKENRESGREEE